MIGEDEQYGRGKHKLGGSKFVTFLSGERMLETIPEKNDPLL